MKKKLMSDLSKIYIFWMTRLVSTIGKVCSIVFKFDPQNNKIYCKKMSSIGLTVQTLGGGTQCFQNPIFLFRALSNLKCEVLLFGKSYNKNQLKKTCPEVSDRRDKC